MISHHCVITRDVQIGFISICFKNLLNIILKKCLANQNFPVIGGLVVHTNMDKKNTFISKPLIFNLMFTSTRQSHFL